MFIVNQLFIYPVKSLGGIEVSSAMLTERGFEHDRRWMLVDANNRFISQRELPELALLKVSIIDQGLKVTYLLDGSVRKSSGRVRIAARLVRGENSYVIWTNTYDRPLSDLIMVQDEIAGEVVKALESTIGASEAHGKSH